MVTMTRPCDESPINRCHQRMVTRKKGVVGKFVEFYGFPINRCHQRAKTRSKVWGQKLLKLESPINRCHQRMVTASLPTSWKRR